MLKIWIFATLLLPSISLSQISDGIDAPNFIRNVTLDASNPTNVLWLGDMSWNDGIIVCWKGFTPSTNAKDFLKIYVTHASGTDDLKNFDLYDSSGSENETFVSNLNDVPSGGYTNAPKTANSESGCFTLVSNSSNLVFATVLFHIPSNKTQNCDTPFIFEVPINSTTLSASSNITGSCEVTFLSSQFEFPGFQIGAITINDAATPFIFQSTINQKLFLQYSGNTDFNNFGIYTPALSVIIPAGNEISIEISIFQDFYTIQRSGSAYYLNGIMSSPSYAGFTYNSPNSTLLYKSFMQRNTTMNFSVQELDGNSAAILYYGSANSSHNFVKGENYSVTAKTFTVENPSDASFLISYRFQNTWTPNIRNITLSSNTPYYISQMSDIAVNDALVICSAAKDIELFLTDASFDSFYFYDSPATTLSFENPLASPAKSNSPVPPQMTSTMGCLIVYRWSHIETDAILFARSRSSHTQNCKSPANVFQLYETSGPILSLQSLNGSCEMVLLAASYEDFSTISIDNIGGSKNETFTIKSTINNQALAAIPAADAKYWIGFGVYTYALSVVIPPQSTLFFSGTVQKSNYTISKYPCQHIQKGIMASPSLSGLQLDLSNPQLLYHSEFAQSNTMNIMVKILGGNQTIEINGHPLLLNQAYSEVNKSLELKIFNSTSSDNFLIEYTITSNFAPNYNYITLNESSPYFVAFMDEIPANTANVICGEPDDLEIFVTEGNTDSFCLYNSKTLEDNIVLGSDYPINSSSGCFNFYRSSTTSASSTVLIRSRQDQSIHCGSTSTVFITNSTDISMAATSDGDCEVLILASKFSDLTAISIDSIGPFSSGSLLLNSAFNGNSLADIPSTETDNWQNFGIYTYALSAIIPSNNTVQISTSIKTGEYEIAIQPCQSVQQGIIASPSYSNINTTLSYGEEIYQSTLPQNSTIKFDVIEMYGSGQVRLYYDTFFNILLKPGDSVTVTAKSFSIKVFNHTSKSDGFLIHYSIAAPFSPKFKTYNLTDANPYYLAQLDDFALNDAMVVCGDRNDTELFITDGSYDSFYLYDSHNLEFCMPFPAKFSGTAPLKSQSGCFVLFKWNAPPTSATVFIRSQKRHTVNCNSPANVFQVPSTGAVTAKSGPCEMVFLASKYTTKSLISVESIKISENGTATFSSTINKKSIFAISAMSEAEMDDILLWKEFAFYTSALTVSVSGGNDMTLVTKESTGPYSIPKSGCIMKQKGILTTPSFMGVTSSTFNSSTLYETTFDRNQAVQFDVLAIDPAANITVEYDGGIHRFDGTETFTIDSTSKFTIKTSENAEISFGSSIKYTLTSAITPNYKFYNFSNANPLYFLNLDDLQVNDAAVFCSSSSDVIEVFVIDGKNIATYFWAHHSSNMDNCQSVPSGFGPSPISNSIDGCFNLYRFYSGITGATILVRSQKLHTQNCGTTSNIFQVSDTQANHSVFTTSQGGCEMLIFSQPTQFNISTLFSIDSIDGLQNGSISLVNPMMPTKTIAQILAAESQKWKSFGIYTPMLKFTVPPNNNFSLSTHLSYGPYQISKLMDGQKGVMVSPGFTGQNALNETIKYYGISSDFNITVNLIVKEIVENYTVVFQSHTDGYRVNSNLTYANQQITGIGREFGLYANELTEWDNEFLIEYTLVSDLLHPKMTNYSLSEKVKSHALWLDEMNVNDAITVCSLAGDLQIQVTPGMNSADLTKFRLFDSNELLNFVSDLQNVSYGSATSSKAIIPGKLKSKTGCFTVYREDGTPTMATAFFSIPSLQSQNCVSDNVFQSPTPSSGPVYLNVGARQAGPCEMIILASQSSLPLISIENLTATADTNFVLKNLINQKQLYNLSSTDATQFKKVGIYTYALSILVQPGKIINVLSYSMEVPYQITAGDANQIGFMTSPSFNGIYPAANVFANPLYQIFSNDTLSVTVNVKSLNGGMLSMKTPTQTITLSPNQPTTATGGDFSFIFNGNTLINDGFLLEYSINQTLSTSDAPIPHRVNLNIGLYCLIAIVTAAINSM